MLLGTTSLAWQDHPSAELCSQCWPHTNWGQEVRSGAQGEGWGIPAAPIPFCHTKALGLGVSLTSAHAPVPPALAR